MVRAAFRRPGDRTDLSTPRGAVPMGSRYDSDAFGRFSEAIARFLGTGRFLVAQTVLVVGWIILNTIGLVQHWDPYPFILLNLAFSTQAAYAAPLILLAQNRQDERDRANIERDREVAARTQADTEYLARELAAIRLALDEVVTVHDIEDSMSRLEKLITDRNGPEHAGHPERPEDPEDTERPERTERTEGEARLPGGEGRGERRWLAHFPVAAKSSGADVYQIVSCLLRVVITRTAGVAVYDELNRISWPAGIVTWVEGGMLMNCSRRVSAVRARGGY